MSIAGPKQIKMARYALDWTVKELALKAHVQPGTVSRVENGGEAFVSTLEKITQALEAGGAIFIDEEDKCGVLVYKDSLSAQGCANNDS